MIPCQDFTLHTHTNLFDGKNTAVEMINAAKKCGMVAIGISNHFIVHPDISTTKSYAAAQRGEYAKMYMSNFNNAIYEFLRHYEELRQIAEHESIRVLCGMEVDFFDSRDWQNGFEKALKILKPDYIIGSGHFIEYGGTLCNIHDMANAEADEREKMLHEYWKKISRIARSGFFNWLAHLDLPKKRDLGRDEKWRDDEERAVRAIAESNAHIEINAKGFTLSCKEAYPSPRILKMVADADIPVLISDDAHSVDQVCRNFEDAERLINEFDIKKRVQLTDFS